MKYLISSLALRRRRFVIALKPEKKPSCFLKRQQHLMSYFTMSAYNPFEDSRKGSETTKQIHKHCNHSKTAIHNWRRDCCGLNFCSTFDAAKAAFVNSIAITRKVLQRFLVSVSQSYCVIARSDGWVSFDVFGYDSDAGDCSVLKKKEIHIQWQSWRHCHNMCNVIKAKYVKVKLALHSLPKYSQKSSHRYNKIHC